MIKFKMNGLMYRFLNVYAGIPNYKLDNFDLCNLLKGIFVGFFRSILLTLLLTFLVSPIGGLITWIVFEIKHSTFMLPNDFVIGGFILYVLFILFVCGALFIDWLGDRFKNNKKQSNLGIAYQAWKDKVCVFVKFE